eukprot:g78969.t1
MNTVRNLCASMSGAFLSLVHRCFYVSPPYQPIPSETIVLVTGSSTGIGKEAALELYRLGATVIVHARSEQKVNETIQSIRSALPAEKHGNLWSVVGDLADLEQVCDIVTQLEALRQEKKIKGVDVLINNAGTLAKGYDKDNIISVATIAYHSDKYNVAYENTPFRLGVDVLINNAGTNRKGPDTPQGYEQVWGTNYVAPYLLTRLLISQGLLSTSTGRVVNVASCMHRRTGFQTPKQFSLLLPQTSLPSSSSSTSSSSSSSLSSLPLRLGSTYSASKLANVLFTLSCRSKFPEMTHVCVAPGAVLSDIWREFFPPALKPLILWLLSWWFLTPLQGASTSIYAASLPASDPLLKHIYLQPYWMGLEYWGPHAGAVPTPPLLPKDAEKVAAALWDLTDKSLAVRFVRLS